MVTLRTKIAATDNRREARREMNEKLADVLLHLDGMNLRLIGIRIDAEGRVEVRLDGQTERLTPEQLDHLGLEV